MRDIGRMLGHISRIYRIFACPAQSLKNCRSRASRGIHEEVLDIAKESDQRIEERLGQMEVGRVNGALSRCRSE